MLLLDEPFGALDAITRRQVRDELAEILADLELPTLLVTHAFEDATVLADRVGVLDEASSCSLPRPTELLRAPANVIVAALTGANVLDGVAQPSPTGSLIRLIGGGELTSSTAAEGPVQIAVHPWALELTDPQGSALIETVVAVRPDRGALVVRLTRFTVQAPANLNGRVPLGPGSAVGLRAAPPEVRVFARTDAR